MAIGLSGGVRQRTIRRPRWNGASQYKATLLEIGKLGAPRWSQAWEGSLANAWSLGSSERRNRNTSMSGHHSQEGYSRSGELRVGWQMKVEAWAYRLPVSQTGTWDVECHFTGEKRA